MHDAERSRPLTSVVTLRNVEQAWDAPTEFLSRPGAAGSWFLVLMLGCVSAWLLGLGPGLVLSLVALGATHDPTGYRHLLRNGRLAPAVAVDMIHRGATLDVVYDFLPEGAQAVLRVQGTCTGVGWAAPGPLHGLTIVYDPRRPERSAIFQLEQSLGDWTPSLPPTP